MKKKSKVGILLLVLSLAAGGCGQKPITMTQEEEAMIVAYAAHVVSKFNTRQPDGLSHVSEAVYEKKTAGDTKQPEETDTEAVQAEEAVDGTEVQNGNQEETEQKKEDEPQQEDNKTGQASLSEALGLDGIAAEYKEAELKASYVEPDYFALDASAGNTFLIVHITLTNETDQEIACDILSQKLEIKALINDSVQALARTTILLNDLGTYQDTIGAKASAETVLFFEVPADKVSSIESLKLTIEKDGVSKEVVL